MIEEQLRELCDATKDKNWGELLLELVDVLYLVCNMTQEAGLESVLSAAIALKHAANMKKSFPSREEATDNAKEFALSLKMLGSVFRLLRVGDTH